MRSSLQFQKILPILLLALVTLAYASHFQNGFHFDDTHTVTNNPYIRDWRNIPKFWTDGRTFSVEPRNRTYRPVVSTTLAMDYWLGGGLKPFYFHLSTFLLYLLQLGVMYVLFRRIFEVARPDPRNSYVAAFAAAWFGLHPAMAETVNYVIQRADLYNTLGVLAALLLYAARPRWRRFGVYLIPAALAILSKAPALIFPAMFLLYVWYFEEEITFAGLRRALVRSMPAFAMTAALAVFSVAMTPKEFHAVSDPYAYRITQPLVAFRYFGKFFLPGGLSADTDFQPISTIWNVAVCAGFLFVASLIAVCSLTAKSREWRPVSFGLAWFLLGLVPTALYPLSEVENDHRMFFPFVGLALAVVWPIALWIYQLRAPGPAIRFGLPIVVMLMFAVLLLATVQRNLVWRTEESLWRGVTETSPKSPRGWLNYGTALIGEEKYDQARDALQQGLRLRPDDALMNLNLAVVAWKVHFEEEAERRFQKAIHLSPRETRIYYAYAGFLADQYLYDEALQQLDTAVQLNADFLPPFNLAMQIHAERGKWAQVRKIADYILARFPKEPIPKAYLLMAAREGGLAINAEGLHSPDNYLNLSVLYYQAQKYRLGADAAQEVLRQNPGSAEAYGNLAACYRALSEWDKAIEAARHALQIRPNWTAAQRSLKLAEQKDSTSS